LAEIAKEEESLHLKLEEAVNRLKDGQIKLSKVAQELPELKKEELSPMARRTEEIGEGVLKSWDAAREVYTDYRRILKELKANRVQGGMINKVNDRICEPLDAAINGEYVQADEALRELQKRLDAKEKDQAGPDQARKSLDQLINRLNGVLEAMADVTTINKLIEMLTKIEKGEREEYDRLQKLLKQKQEDVLENLDPKKPEK
jgi:SPX domain protein involved in polyphosphate accumulation